MSTLNGKYFKPEVGAAWWRRPSHTEDARGGTFTERAAPGGYEIVGIESGFAMVRLPNGKFSYVALTDGQVTEPPPPTRKVTEFERELWDGLHTSDPDLAAKMAVGTDWAPPKTLDLSGVPDFRAAIMKLGAAHDFETTAQMLADYKASASGQKEMAQFADAKAQAAAAHAEQQKAATNAAPAANPFAALFGGSR